jgi:hypothetical protein
VFFGVVVCGCLLFAFFFVSVGCLGSLQALGIL